MDASQHITERLLERNRISREFFAQESNRLAETCKAMAERFQRGGRLLAFGRGVYATDAQHVAVEFVHPVIVGKRALPALDLSMAFESWLEVLVQPEDMVMGFGPPEGDALVQVALERAKARGAMTFALSGALLGALSGALSGVTANYTLEAPSSDPFIHQELIEVLYHTLWETVHVFLEHQGGGQDVGASSFLYPFLGGNQPDKNTLVAEVASSIEAKAREDETLRELAARDAPQLIEAAKNIRERLERGGKIITFGNGGSATDANDFVLDCVNPPNHLEPIPAISLSLEPANISAIANDVGTELIFLRQLVAHAKPEDVAVAFSTSGGSANITVTLETARKLGLYTIAFLGRDGGEIVKRQLADAVFVVRTEHIPRIQEIHASLYHLLREVIHA